MKNTIKGKYEETKGRAQQTWGRATDDPDKELEGVANESKGRLRQSWESLKERISRAIR